jgi:hypothetical protein
MKPLAKRLDLESASLLDRFDRERVFVLDGRLHDQLQGDIPAPGSRQNKRPAGVMQKRPGRAGRPVHGHDVAERTWTQVFRKRKQLRPAGTPECSRQAGNDQDLDGHSTGDTGQHRLSVLAEMGL